MSFINVDVTIKKTENPTVTGTSVLGIKFDKGVMIAADMLGSFRTLAKYRNLSRVMEVNKQIALGCGGDYADFQYLSDIIKQKIVEETCLDEDFYLKPKSLLCWLTRFINNCRSKLNPFNLVIGGMQDSVPFLATVDKFGKAFQDDCIGTDLGYYIAVPIMREALNKNKTLNKKEAAEVINKCMRLLFYRDARSYEKYELVVITEEGVKIHDPITVDTNWDIAYMVKNYE